MNKKQKGFALIEILIAIGLLALLAGGGYYALRGKNGSATEMMEEKEMMEKEAKDAMEAMEAAMEKKNGMMEEGSGMMEKNEITAYAGEVLAGNSATPLLDFVKSDYDAALGTEKLIVLYFYANWCPICKREVRDALYPAFQELAQPNVIGFRVNFNDDETDADEKALAREFGVAYQHTKVFVKNDRRILKSPEGWEKNRYLTEISNATR